MRPFCFLTGTGSSDGKVETKKEVLSQQSCESARWLLQQLLHEIPNVVEMIEVTTASSEVTKRYLRELRGDVVVRHVHSLFCFAMAGDRAITNVTSRNWLAVCSFDHRRCGTE